MKQTGHTKVRNGDASADGDSPSRLIDARIKELGDWRGEMLSRMICTGETYKNVVKVTFARGARLDDPSKLFNASSRAAPGVASICTKARHSTDRPSRRSYAARSR